MHLVLKKVVVDIFIFILCDMIVYVGIFKEEIQHQSTKLFSDMAWSHGMANGWLEKLFCTSDIDVSNTRRLSGNENVSKRLSSHPPRTASSIWNASFNDHIFPPPHNARASVSAVQIDFIRPLNPDLSVGAAQNPTMDVSRYNRARFQAWVPLKSGLQNPTMDVSR